MWVRAVRRSVGALLSLALGVSADTRQGYFEWVFYCHLLHDHIYFEVEIMIRRLTFVLLACLVAPAFGQVYHLSGRNVIAADPITGVDRDNQVWMFDASGSYLGSYAQEGSANTDGWGYRDGATDGNGDVYFGWSGGVNKHAADGTFLGQVITGAPASTGTWRALAFDPTGDGGNGSLWSADFSSSVIEVDLSGNLLTTLPNGGYSLYGLAYDDDTGNLWGHSSGGAVVNIDSTDGTVISTFQEGFSAAVGATAVTQGGLSGYSELGGNLAALCQCTLPDPNDPTATVSGDSVGLYSTSGAIGINFNSQAAIPAKFVDNQLLGVAVIGVVPEPNALALLAMGALGMLVRRRR